MAGEISVFKSSGGEARSLASYQAALARWPVPYEELDLPTSFGATHVIISGSSGSPPVVLLHGQDSSATSWGCNIADLSAAFRCHAVDTIGDFGRSKPRRLPASRQDYSEWLKNVFDALQLDVADIVGLSYGGFLAVNFALDHPQAVRRMVLLSPGIPNFGPLTWRWANFGLPMMLLPSRRTIRRFIGGASTRGYVADDPVYEQMIVAMPELRHGSFMRPVFTDAELGRVTTQTMLLIGDQEIMYEPRGALERAARLLPNSRTVLVQNAGHMLNSDQPAVVDKLIVDFLAE
ncbi:MAG TPA: alpha/beta hydrolase [Anaerolineales bacterium]|nr:alpha/beta hydrolase [Anaerolineales bacterium]